MQRKSKIIIVVIALIVSSALLMKLDIGMKGMVTADESVVVSSTAVKIQEVKRGSISKNKTYSGKAIPKSTISLTSKVPGTVTSINKDIGDPVKKGDILLKIDDSDIENSIRDTNNQIESSLVTLDRQKANYNQQLTHFESTKTLYEAGALSKYEYDVQSLKLEDLEKQVKQTELSIERLRISKEKLLSKKEDSIIRSPIDGVVNKRSVDNGEIIGSNTVAFEVIDMSHIYVDVNIEQGNINDIKASQSIRLRMIGDKNRNFEGEIKHISPVADDKNLNYGVRIEVNNRDNYIQPGMLCKVDFTLEEVKDSVLVPIDSVIDDSYIYLVVDDKAVKYDIQAGMEDNEYIRVINDIPNGSMVVVKGQEYLSDGDSVIVVD